MKPRAIFGLLALASMAACAASPAGPVPGRTEGWRTQHVQEVRLPRPMPTTMIQGGAALIPWASLDLDEKTRNPGTPRAQVDDGDGLMIRTGSYDDALGVEFVLQTTEHDETASDSSLRTVAGYVDLTQRSELWDGPVSAWAGVGFGMGLMHFDWDGSYRSEVTGLWVAEGIFALQFGPHVSVETRILGFSASHPGRSAGTGVLATIGGSIGF